MKSKETLRLTAGSLLLAVSLLIPSLLGGVVTLPIGPFTATPASHVPTLLSMLLGPVTAGIVGMGSAIGFSYGWVLVARERPCTYLSESPVSGSCGREWVFVALTDGTPARRAGSIDRTSIRLAYVTPASWWA